MDSPIDIWNIDTYDTELRSLLDDNSEMIRSYFVASQKQLVEARHDPSKRCLPISHSQEFNHFTKRLGALMRKRKIRAWHYTRLTDEEVDALQRHGIQLSNLDTIRARLEAQVAAGTFTEDVAKQLLADSPFKDPMQQEGRTNRFWMLTPPASVEHSGVRPLMERWGGEGVFFNQSDPDLNTQLKGIGRPRVLEISLPFVHLSSTFEANLEIVKTFSQALGCQTETNGLDLDTQQPLGSEHILAVHSEGDAIFSTIARGYPGGYKEACCEPRE